MKIIIKQILQVLTHKKFDERKNPSQAFYQLFDMYICNKFVELEPYYQ